MPLNFMQNVKINTFFAYALTSFRLTLGAIFARTFKRAAFSVKTGWTFSITKFTSKA